jgi:NitT/TauT family transport system ATP-binding protein
MECVTEMNARIEFAGLTKSFPKDGRMVKAVQGVNLTIGEGEFIAVVGPSGCGKSTLLNMLAGLFQPTIGTVRYDGKEVSGINTRIGYVTQRDNLLPWRDVAANVGLPLALRHTPKAEARKAIDDVIAQVGLTGFERHYPRELSGGMRKRVTLARSLVYDPETLALDEPFGALDAQLKRLLQAQLLSLWSGTGKTILFVTHDLDEAVRLADRVVVMSARPGRIKAVENIDLPRPRESVVEQAKIVDKLWTILRDDVRLGTDV